MSLQDALNIIFWRPNTKKSKSSLPKTWLIVAYAALQACALYSVFLAGNRPEVLHFSLARSFSITILLCSIIIGALACLVLRNMLLKDASHVVTLACASIEIAGACFIALGCLPSDFCAILSSAGLFCAGLIMPFALFKMIDAAATISTEHQFVAAVGTIGLLMLTRGLFWCSIELVSMVTVITLILSGIFTFALGKKPLYTDAELISQEYTESSYDDNSTSRFAMIKNLMLSIPFFGILLSAFTAGTVTRSLQISLESILYAVAALVIALAALAFFVHRSSARTLSGWTFLVVDVGLPSLAIVAFSIKMIPHDVLPDETFAFFMMLYFLVLAGSYVFNCATFAASNRHLLPEACSITLLICAIAIVLGLLTTLLSFELRNLIMGFVTAGFIICAICVGALNLVLYSKSDDTSDDAVASVDNLSEMCEKIGREHKLTPREVEVLKELAHGHSSTYIAKSLFIATNTARTHMKNIYRKLSVGSREELIETIRHSQAHEDTKPKIAE